MYYVITTCTYMPVAKFVVFWDPGRSYVLKVSVRGLIRIFRSKLIANWQLLSTPVSYQLCKDEGPFFLDREGSDHTGSTPAHLRMTA